MHREQVDNGNWVLPSGEAVQQQGDRQTDLLLVWAADEAEQVPVRAVRGARRGPRDVPMVSERP